MNLIRPLLMTLTLTSLLQHITVGQRIRWQLATPLPPAAGQATQWGMGGALVGSHNGYLLVAGGSHFGGKMPWKGGVKLYESDSYLAKFSKHKLFWEVSTQLPISLAYAAVCSGAEGIYAVGGENAHGIQSTAHLFQINRGKLQHSELPPLPKGLTNAAATLLGDYLYVAGGETPAAASAAVYRLPRKGGVWEAVAALPVAVSHATLLASNGRLYLFGGRAKQDGKPSALYPQVLEYTPETNSWQKLPDMPLTTPDGLGWSAGAGVTLPNGHILLFGGDEGGTFRRIETLNLAIQEATDKAALQAEKETLLTTHQGFTKTVRLFDPATRSWEMLPELPFATPVTTTAIRCENRIWLPSGEIKPGIRTPQVLCGKLLKP